MRWVSAVVAWLDWLPAAWVASIRGVLTWIDGLFAQGGGWREWETVVFAAILFCCPLLVFVLEAAWALMRWWVPEAGSGPRRLLLAAVAAELRAGGTPADCLRTIAPHLRRPWSRRAWVAADRLRNGEGSLPVVLAEERLIPAGQQAGCQAAWDTGPAAMAAWCLEATPPMVHPLSVRLAPLLWQVVSMIVLLTCFGRVILPKLAVIFAQDGPAAVASSPSIRGAMMIASWWPLLLLAGGLAAAAVAVLVNRLGWLGTRRRQLGDLLLRAAAEGRSEAAIAGALAAAGLRLRGLAAAGAAGDFAALCRACGWRAADPDSLAAALAADRWRRQRRQAWLVAALAIAAPLLLALPVAWVGITIFGFETALLEHLRP